MSSDLSIPQSSIALDSAPYQAKENAKGDIAIRATNLSKIYQVYDRPQDRLKQFLYPRLQRLAGSKPKNYFREISALKDVSFEVRRGETIGIIGRNGAGKSTLLQMVCGTLTPSRGTIETYGRVAALLELGSGFNPEFTGRENVYMNATILGLNQDEINDKFSDIVAFADIGEFINQPVKTYSSGMFVRLAFAVIAHVDAEILVIDEALAVGDAVFTQKCMRFLRDFMDRGTILFVSHDTGAVLNLCMHSIWLNEGSVKLAGQPKEVVEAYLEECYRCQQGDSFLVKTEMPERSALEEVCYKDMRLDFINTTQLRNDVELFKFQTDSPSFGKGGATIVSVNLLDKDGAHLSWFVGGEEVVLSIKSKINTEITSPIVGFYVKDRLGQTLFGDNTYIQYHSSPVSVHADQTLSTHFSFRMPVLPVGDYSINVAIADGTQENYVEHHWIHDALLFKSHTSSVCHGLMGIPMRNIRFVIE